MGTGTCLTRVFDEPTKKAQQGKREQIKEVFMARGKVITTHLRTGDPNGIRTVFISNKICAMTDDI